MVCNERARFKSCNPIATRRADSYRRACVVLKAFWVSSTAGQEGSGDCLAASLSPHPRAQEVIELIELVSIRWTHMIFGTDALSPLTSNRHHALSNHRHTMADVASTSSILYDHAALDAADARAWNSGRLARVAVPARNIGR